jgi:hypothetical protein
MSCDELTVTNKTHAASANLRPLKKTAKDGLFYFANRLRKHGV